MDSLILIIAQNANVGNHYNKTKNTVNQRQVMEKKTGWWPLKCAKSS